MPARSQVRSVSKVQLLLYRSGFERRRGQFAVAADLLTEANRWVPPDPSLLLRARVFEQQAELRRTRDGDDRAGREELDEALRLYAQEPGLILFGDWPIVLRLRRTCRRSGLDFGSYFRLGGAVLGRDAPAASPSHP